MNDKMKGLCFVLLLALLQTAASFSVSPSIARKGTISVRMSDEASDAVNASDSVNEPTPPPFIPPKPIARLDPLMAALTRNDSTSGKTTKIPLFGEVDVDGSLIVLVPAVVIGVLGFVMSIVVAINAKDTFVDQLVQISNEINTMAVQKTNAMVDPSVCRGLCSTQEQDLDNLRGFMESLRKP